MQSGLEFSLQPGKSWAEVGLCVTKTLLVLWVCLCDLREIQGWGDQPQGCSKAQS